MSGLSDTEYEIHIKSLYESLFNKDAANINIEVLEEIKSEIQKIKEENLNLNIAIDFSVDNIHLTDGEGNILRVNSAFEERVGCKRQDIEGRNVRELESEGAYKPSVVRMVIQEKRRLTLMQEGPTGKTITTSTPVFDENNNLFRIVSNARLVDELTLLSDYFRDSAKSIIEETKDIKLVSESQVMKSLIKQLELIANVDSGVLFRGESGTGKSLLAKYIHEKSARRSGRFMQINCAAIPESLIESELFGYETGAFSGASKTGKPGLIELADKGTLFLDEVGDMPLPLQVKLLQVLQNKQVTRVGGEQPIDLDVRIISATNQDLEKMIEEKTFRQDLYYRLNVIPIEIPPLKGRKEDIKPLLEWLVKKYNEKYQKHIILSDEVISYLMQYDWPGNIREMENLIERLIVINEIGIITIDDLPVILASSKNKLESVVIRKIIPLKDAVEEVERQLIINAYQELKSSYKVAKMLGISQSAAMRRIRKYLGDENESMKSVK